MDVKGNIFVFITNNCERCQSRKFGLCRWALEKARLYCCQRIYPCRCDPPLDYV